MRILTSFAVVVALVTVLVAGGCLGCWTPFQKAPARCCNAKGQCEKPGKAPVHKDCSTSAIDLGSNSQPDVAKLVMPPAEATLGALVAHTDSRDAAPSDYVDPYSPPDLYLLNSVLTI